MLMLGVSNKKVYVVNNHSEGASKKELVEKAVATFSNLEPDQIVIQVWDKDFNEFADLEDNERVSGPTKVRVVQIIPVLFSQEVLESGGT